MLRCLAFLAVLSAVTGLAGATLPALAAPPMSPFATSALVEGFEKIAFGAEIPGLFGGGRYIKKFVGPVAFYIENHAARDRRREVRSFVTGLPRQIVGLETSMAASAAEARFVVHVVDTADYQRIGRKIFRNPFRRVPGSCLVHADYGRAGIVRADALIVSDDGEPAFRRCLVEEVLQGLGPLDDFDGAPDSVFNDTSTVTRFGRYDRIMLNMLYDDRLTPGMSAAAARPLLPAIAETVRRRVR